MATDSWTGATSGTSNFWRDASQWSNRVPIGTSDVVIGKAGTYSVSITAVDRPYQIRSLSLGNALGTIRLVDDNSLSITGQANLIHGIFDVGATGTGSILRGFTFDATSTVMSEGVLNVGGAMQGKAGSTVVIDGGSIFAGSVTGSGKYTISLDGSLEVGGNITNTTSITFADSGANTLLLDGVGTTLDASVSGFGGKNQIDIGALPFQGDYTTSYSGTTLTILENGAPVFTFAHINNPGAFAFSDDGGGGTEMSVCYARGTMLRTPDGEVAVEALIPGAQVMTLVDGMLLPARVVWVGSRHLDLTTHPTRRLVAPVRIERGAFADGVPHRDLLVSPDHAILADGKLICARQLLNGVTISQEADQAEVDYYHLELESHAIVLAEGLPAETYLDTGNRGFFAVPGLRRLLYPDPSGDGVHPTREANSCAPFVTDPASIRPIWQRLADRAEALGRSLPKLSTTDDPALRLLADGHPIKPIAGDDRRFVFALPRNISEVRLVSRASAPSDTQPWLGDCRRLGVSVSRLVIRDADEVYDVPLDHPNIARGWWAPERDGIALRRWTDGDAVLPLPAMLGLAVLEVRLAGTVTYIA